MTKKRTNKHGFVFENKIDLSRWDFNRLEWQLRDTLAGFENAINNAINKETDRLEKKIGAIDSRARKIASEAMQITFEEDIYAMFWNVSEHPELLTVMFGSLGEDGYEVNIDLKEAIKDCLLNRCDGNGYVSKESEQTIVKFADMLKEIETELRTAIRPKEKI